MYHRYVGTKLSGTCMCLVDFDVHDWNHMHSQCSALAHLRHVTSSCSGLDMQAYWQELQSNGIDAERLASYDRSITHEPDFAKTDTVQLRADLEAYLATLSAVHGGHDLQAAALAVIGYKQVRTSACFLLRRACSGVLRTL
jgi:hypothetical protein